MRISARFVLLVSLAAVGAAACHSAAPPVAPVVVPLSESAAAAVRWVQANATPFSTSDSLPRADESARIAALAGDARIIGVSEMAEGTKEFPTIVGHMLFALAESNGVRGLAIQAPMAEAMEVDRYVRTGNGDLRRLLHQLGSWRWETPEMVRLVNEIRDWNTSHPGKPLGFAGFEIPTAAHAVQIVNGLPDSLTGAPLKAWFRREYGCVLTDEAARFGREGRAADSTFWKQCGSVATAAVDSIVALRQRSTAARSAQIAYAEQMARLVAHHVTVGLRYLSRQDADAEHVLYAANLLGPDAKMVVWGGDVEMGRLSLDVNTVQTGVALNARLGAKYRNVAYLVGNGSVRAKPGTASRVGEANGPTSVGLIPPLADQFEGVLVHVPLPAFWLDLRALPNDEGGTWLHGPRAARLINELYSRNAPQLFQTTLEFPKYFDGLVFVGDVHAVR